VLTRRRFLAGGGAAVTGAAAVAAAVAVGLDLSRGSGPSVPRVALGGRPAGLPARQHAWTDVLAHDAFGNPVAPRHDRLLFFDVAGRPDEPRARVLEASLRTLERAYPWSHAGLLVTAGWSPAYFERALGVASPIPRATALSDFELPAIDDYHLCLHLACDDDDRLAAVEEALTGGRPIPGVHGHLSLAGALRWRETRTGFTGAGLPARHQDTGGIPPGRPVAPTAPLFMGFKSGLKKNQATEDAVTIERGPFAGGTTEHVSYMRLRLDSWYRLLDQRQRIARMYAPQMTLAQFDAITDSASGDPGGYDEAVNRYGVIGHSQTTARARRDGKPLIIRRDFDTVDGGQAGLHFVALQRTIADFVTTRTAMNASAAQLQNPAISDTVNNGINEFIFVLRRANYILPPRARRSFPLVPRDWA
jgi:hypothetical protein